MGDGNIRILYTTIRCGKCGEVKTHSRKFYNDKLYNNHNNI
jgi:hypothetical protein